MATPIRIKRSAVPGKVPAQGALQYGELAYNINDAELYAVRNRVGVGSYVARLGAGATVTNVLYVTQDGRDTNTGERLGEAKRTIGAAVTAAREGTIIRVSSGSYLEDNPIVLPKQVSIVGDSLREVSITPKNDGDLIYVTNGNYISDVSFTGSSNGGRAVISFNPNKPDYINQSPYIRNCTNFIPDSIGIKVDGSKAIGPTKSIVTDSFTQYNANGIGVSITNEGYAQIVSLFTICSNISVYAGSGGQCDLSASNSSFGNYGLISDGITGIKYDGRLLNPVPANSTEFVVELGEPRYTITNVEYDNNTGLATVSLDAFSINYVVGCAITIGHVKFTTNEGGSELVSLPNIDSNDIFEVNSLISDSQFTAYVGPSTLTGYTYDSGGFTSKYSVRPYNGQIVYFDVPYYFISRVNVVSGGSGYTTAPEITIEDPTTDFGIPPIATAVIKEGSVVEVVVSYPGRGYTTIPSVIVESSPTLDDAIVDVELEPTFYTVVSATPVTGISGITTITLNEPVPFEFNFGQTLDFHVQSKILASGHGFEYVGTGVTIQGAVPSRGAVAIEDNQVDERNGGIVVYTSTDQLGKFKIGDGIVIDQASGTISGNDYTKNLFTTLTPLILALGD